MYNIHDLKSLEYKLKHLQGGAQIRYFNQDTYILKATSLAVYIPEFDAIYLRKKPIDFDEEEYIRYLFVLLHEIVHSTAHPARLNREYMSAYKFNSRRSIYAYLRKEFENFTLTPEEYDQTVELEVSLKYFKEEILADSVAIKIFKKLKISTKLLIDINHIKYNKKKLYSRSKTEESYQEHLKDISRKVNLTYRYIANLLELD